jgi:Recombinase
MSTSQGEFVIGITYDFNPNTIDGIDRQIVFGEEMSRRIGVRRFQREGINFPHRGRCGAGRGEVTWGPLDLFRVLQILHSPRYAGAFVFGRTRVKRTADLKSKTQVQVARDDWGVLIHGAHAGYISWEEFERNQVTLKCNLAALSLAGRGAVPREGGALLQGRAM